MNSTILIFGCLCWAPLTLWFLCLVHWMVGGDIELPFGLAGIAIGLGLGLIAYQPPVPILSPIACGTAFLTLFAFPLVRYVANRHQLKSVDIELVDRAYRVLGNNPANQLAKFKLAESIYKNGLIGHAVALGDVAVANLPERIAAEEYRMLRRWKSAGVPHETLKPIICIECHSPCLPGWTHCRTCGAPFLLDRVRGRFLPSGIAEKLVAVWAAAVVLLIGFPLSTVLHSGASFAMMLGSLAVAGAVLFLAFRPRGMSA